MKSCANKLALVLCFFLLTLAHTLYAQKRPDLVWMRGAHAQRVLSAAYSPDGRYFASTDPVVKLWRLSDGMLLRTLGTGRVIAFTPDGKRLAGAYHKTLTFWQVADGAQVGALTSFTGNIRALVFSPDGTNFAVGMDDNHIQIRRVSDGSLLQTLQGHKGYIDSLAFSPDGQLLASGSGDGDGFWNNGDHGSDNTAKIWRVADGRLLLSIAGTRGVFGYKVAFSSDGNVLLLGILDDTTDVRRYRVADGVFVNSFYMPSIGGFEGDNAVVERFSFSPNGQTVAFGTSTTTELYNAADGTHLRSVAAGYDYGTSIVKFAPDGLTLATGAADMLDFSHAVEFLRVSDGTILGDLTSPGPGGWINVLTVSPNGQIIGSSVSNHGSVNLRRTSDGALITSLPNGQPTGVAISPDGKFAATSYGYKTFAVWRIFDGTLLQVFNLDSWQTDGVAFSPDGSLVAGSSQAGITIWRVSDGKLIKILPGYGKLAFSPDGQTLLAGYSGVDIWRVSDWSKIKNLHSSGTVTSIAVSTDSRTLAVGNDSGTATLWDLASGTNSFTLPTSGSTTSVALSPDGLVLAVGSDDAHLTLWSISGHQVLASYDAETGTSAPRVGGVFGVFYSPDSKFLYYGRGDGTVCCALNPYHNSVFPNHGGNSGNVTVKIITPLDFPIQDGTTVKLTAAGQPDIVPLSTTVDSNTNYVLSATLALNGAPLGKRDVVITLPSGQARTYPQGFTIEQGTAPQLKADVIGRHTVRGGQMQTFNVVVSNLGNVDAHQQKTLWIIFPNYMSWSVSTQQTPTVLEDAGENTILLVPISDVSAGSSTTTQLKLVAPDGGAFAHRKFQIWAGTTDVLQIDGPAEVWGRVTDVDTQAMLGGAIVSAEQNGVVLTTVATTSNGQYVLAGLPSGTYTLHVRMSQYTEDIHNVAIVKDIPQQLDVALKITRPQINGTVTDAISHAVISGVTIVISQDSNFAKVAMTDTDGIYSVSGLLPGTYTLRFLKATYVDVERTVNVVAGQSITVNVALSKYIGWNLLPKPRSSKHVVANGAGKGHDQKQIRQSLTGPMVNSDSYPQLSRRGIFNCAYFRQCPDRYPSQPLPAEPQNCSTCFELWTELRQKHQAIEALQRQHDNQCALVLLAKFEQGVDVASAVAEALAVAYFADLVAEYFVGDGAITAAEFIIKETVSALVTEFGNALLMADEGDLSSTTFDINDANKKSNDIITKALLEVFLVNVKNGLTQKILKDVGQFAKITDALGPAVDAWSKSTTAVASAVTSEHATKRQLMDMDSEYLFYLALYQNCQQNFGMGCGHEIITSGDPNDLDGPLGYSDLRWTSATQWIRYGVYFENMPMATAPAAEIIVNDHLDATKLDMTTVNLQSITFANQIVTPTLEVSLPVGVRQFNADVDLRPAKNLIVRINANLDMLTGDLTWHFSSLDPATMQPPDDPTVGFLDPGQEGSVLFSVTPKRNIPTGTILTNQASIKFDFNPWIDTPVWFNTIDSDLPVSQVNALNRTQAALSFPVSWKGTDLGAGLRDFTILVSDSGGAFTPWLTGTTDTQAIFSGLPNHIYAFKAQARDNVFNMEAEHAQADAVTTTPNIALDVSSQVSVTQSGFRLNRTTGRFVQTVTLTNNGSAITGPLSLVLDSLSSNAGLFNKTGTTNAVSPAGSAYLDVQAGDMAAGASVTVTLEFTNPTKGAISYSARVLAGSGNR